MIKIRSNGDKLRIKPGSEPGFTLSKHYDFPAILITWLETKYGTNVFAMDLQVELEQFGFPTPILTRGTGTVKFAKPASV